MDLKELVKKMLETGVKNDRQTLKTEKEDALKSIPDPIAVLTRMGIEDGYIAEGEKVGVALDLAQRGEEVCTRILAGLQEELKPDFNKPEERWACLCWAAYAGIGAAFLYYSVMEQLLNRGIYETLLKGCELEDLDDSVTAMTGLSGNNEEDGEKLAIHLLRCACELDDMISDLDRLRVGPVFFDLMCAMYLYGLLIENSRLMRTKDNKKYLN